MGWDLLTGSGMVAPLPRWRLTGAMDVSPALNVGVGGRPAQEWWTITQLAVQLQAVAHLRKFGLRALFVRWSKTAKVCPRTNAPGVARTSRREAMFGSQLVVHCEHEGDHVPGPIGVSLGGPRSSVAIIRNVRSAVA